MGINQGPISLDQKYTQQTGHVFTTGIQALVRLPMAQIRRDRANGLNTAGFISGYRGSPLGGYDQQLFAARKHLEQYNIRFQPGVNEDLAATAVWGSQQLNLSPGAKYDGVVGIWYGKGPGVDRCGDVFRHGNAAGSAKNGGVLCLAGDDHGAKSSTVPHQSDHAFISALMPYLYPSSIHEMIEMGLLGIAMSRYSGCWVGMKVITETVETTAEIDLTDEMKPFIIPTDFELPPGGLNLRWPDDRFEQDRRLQDYKGFAAIAFARANKVNRVTMDSPNARFGIMASGKSYEDVRQALRELGITEEVAAKIGLRLYKIGMPWPLEPEGVRQFAVGLEEIFIVEERREIVENQVKQELFNWRDDVRPRIVGKMDEHDKRFLTFAAELSVASLATSLTERLLRLNLNPEIAEMLRAKADWFNGRQATQMQAVAPVSRTPYFCSGCPHNTSTKVPEGSRALAGIGCHFMASWMDRETSSLIQMGGEGVNWAASSRFTGHKHIFQNLGEGTYYHSGSMAIRQAIAAGANITYKILFNDAVAMTGGQPVDGPVSVHAIAHSVRAEGVARIALVSDDPAQFSPADLPSGVTIHPREDMEAVQRELREIPGVSVLIYQQTCATEKRRRRKRGQMVDPKRFAYINDLVCEGCGDCSVESNCLSVEPKETPFGRKRQINLSACNKDFSCLNGFCPSFVTIEGATRRKKSASQIDVAGRAATLPLPAPATLDRPYDLLVTGVGGTGVITVGALIGMAAHLERRGVSVLDFTGFAQKFGPVLSYIRIASSPDALHQVRIDQGAADALIGCDLVVSSSPKASGTYRRGTRAAVNTAEMPTGDVVRFRDADLASPARLRAIRQVVGNDNLDTINANALAERLLGDAVYSNIIMLGFAWQRGLVPVSLQALLRAIELNGVAVERNKQALAWGRIAVADPDFVPKANGAPEAETLEQLIARRAEFLTAYQNAAYATRYRTIVAKVRNAEANLNSEALTEAVARALFKLMAYKDEYEVARLHMRIGFLDELKGEFEDGFTIQYHLAPPFLPSRRDARGRPRKRVFGQWIQIPLAMLARLKGLRGTPFDPFGYTAERRAERELIAWYEGLIERMLGELDTARLPDLVAVAKAPMDIRGYGPVKEAAIVSVKTEVESLLARPRAARAA